MPVKSEAQRRLMEAAAHTRSGFGGVSQAVGREFIGKDAMSKMDAIMAACDALERRCDAMECAACDAAWARADASPTAQLTGKRSNTDYFEQGRQAKAAGCKAGDCPYYATSTAGEQWLKGLKS